MLEIHLEIQAGDESTAVLSFLLLSAISWQARISLPNLPSTEENQSCSQL